MENGQENKAEQDALSGLYIPAFVSITDITPTGQSEAEYVICNEATGKYFHANTITIQFFSALRDSGDIARAVARSGMPTSQAETLIKRLIASGLLCRAGETFSQAAQKAPLESKAIAFRWDIFDSSAIVDRMSWLGRFLYSNIGYGAWLIAMLATLFQLLSHRDKVVYSLQQVTQASWTQWAVLAALYLGLKAAHELGHGMAYAAMCRAEGVSPGPIRMGISTFAFTPFPFTDVTGAWRLKSKWRRMMIGAGGIYFETWAIALLTAFWAQTGSGLVQTIVLQVAVIAGILTLGFNLNPAVKLDGYFILTDYLKQPNLAGRASLSARNWMARRLGANAPAPVRSELTYWLISYTYRLTIFSGVFWMAYQFDKRLAPVVLVIIALMLGIRPLARTLSFAYKAGMTPLRSILAATAVLALIGLCLIPFPDRILLSGQYVAYDTRFVEAAEPGVLMRAEGAQGLRLDAPQLDQQITDASLRVSMLQNLERASDSIAREKTQLAEEIARFAQTETTLRDRQAELAIAAPSDAVWTDFEARSLQDAWVTPSQQQVLAAISTPVEPYFRLRLPQNALERDLTGSGATELANKIIKIRLHHHPACEITAQITHALDQAQLLGETLLIRAGFGDDAHGCAEGLAHGSGVIAHLPTRSRSVAHRLQFAVSRMLQNRIPIEIE